ncbi:MAG TPA: YgaP-like transmembrane domain [Verrucomicrobiae bacterium]|nr:YgaP-like transmembrane domain [Verrucomicrobiae bacterium]
MKQFLSPNISKTGRLLRFLLGCTFVFVGWYLCRQNYKIVSILFFIAGGFTWFEAVRGWCVMRACGVKTKW